ncbi:MAG: hypothetical protein HN578_06585 [Rhodospirillales bacterium]|jgi:hypothetical protein|nr:hypothetical protein [Rhodospirillales bacterium]MBT8002566.1 hypothetical protein [Rhodospirillales bacterium]
MDKEPRPKRHDTADEMVVALGKFVWNFNRLDNRLDYVLGVLLNPEDIALGEIVGSALMFNNKRMLIKALVAHRLPTREDYREFDSKLKEVNEIRNDLVHGEQWFDLEGNLKQRRSRPMSDKGYNPKHMEHSPEEVLQWAEVAYVLEMEVWKFFRSEEAVQPNWQEGSREGELGKAPMIQLSKWYPWDQRGAFPEMNKRGVYVLTTSKRALKSKPASLPRSVIYIGAVYGKTKNLRDRLGQFHRSAQKGKSNHAGGRTYFRKDFDPTFRDIFFSVIPSELTGQQINTAWILQLERMLIWEYTSKYGELPKCNSN